VRIEDGAQAGRPQAVVAAVPAEPALVAHVEQARRVADAGSQTARRGAAILKAASRLVAGGAGHASPLADRRGSKNRSWPRRIAAALPDTRLPGSGAHAGGHGPWAGDARELGGIEADEFRRPCRGKREQKRAGLRQAPGGRRQSNANVMA
jgi:hypothetical protein